MLSIIRMLFHRWQQGTGLGESTPSVEGNHLSQHERKELTGVCVTPELDHIHHFA